MTAFIRPSFQRQAELCGTTPEENVDVWMELGREKPDSQERGEKGKRSLGTAKGREAQSNHDAHLHPRRAFVKPEMLIVKQRR